MVFLIFMSSCKKEIQYKGDGQESVLVINEILEKDSLISVQIERSVFFLDSPNADVSVDGASVSIKNVTTGITESTNVSDNGLYEFDMICIEGHEYDISVNHSDYPPAAAKAFIPSSVSLLSVDTFTVDIPNASYVEIHATLTWNDPLGEDFYIISVDNVSDSGVVSKPWVDASDVSIDYSLSNGVSEGDYGWYLGVLDETFQGGTKSLHIDFLAFDTSEVDFYEYQLYRCTEDAYKYFLSTNKSQNADDNPFTEPIKIHSNITNGIGIFAGISTSVIRKYY